MKRVYYVTTFVVLLLISYLGITYSFAYSEDNQVIEFRLVGPELLYMDVNTEYKEYGVKAVYNGKDISDKVIIDNSLLITNVLGEYKVKYSVILDGVEEYIYRDVKVIDTVSPVIELLGEEKVHVLLNGIYIEDGYKVSDNYDKNLEKEVNISGKVNVEKEGSYFLTYSVMDSSGNKASVKREVVVKKSEVVLAKMDE